MKGWNVLLLFAIIVILAPPVLAGSTTSIYSPGEQINLYAECPSFAVNLSVIGPNASVVLSNVSMSPFAAAWNYSFMLPTEVGDYLAYTDCANGLQGFAAFQIVDVAQVIGMADVALVIGLIALVIFVFWISARENQNRGIHKIIAAFLHIVGIWAIMPLFAYLVYAANAFGLDVLIGVWMAIYVIAAVLYTGIFMWVTVLELIAGSIMGETRRKW